MLRGRLLSRIRCPATKRTLSVWERVSDYFSPKIDPLQPVVLLSGGKHVFSEIVGHCDRNYGGGSLSNWQIVNSEEALEDASEEGRGYLSWEGTLRFDESHAEKSSARGGYAAVRLSLPEPVDLQDYEGFEFEIRSSRDLSIVLNMQCSAYVDKEMFQLPFEVKAHSDFVGLFAPFSLFSLSMNGKYGTETIKNDSRKLTSIGFLLMTERCPPGDFKVDIRRLTATDK